MEFNSSYVFEFLSLVDEDDRGCILARLGEELANPRRAETREHLDECGGALRIELRTGLRGGRAREERLARARRPVQEHAFGHDRTQLLEPLRIAEKFDDLRQLHLRL